MHCTLLANEKNSERKRLRSEFFDWRRRMGGE